MEKVNKEVCVGGSFLVIVKEAPEEDSHHQGEAEKRVELKVAEVLYPTPRKALSVGSSVGP